MSEFEAFLREHGFWALFFAAAFEGDLTLLLSGMLIRVGIWPAPETLAVGAVGALAGDCFYFWLGHSVARRWLTTAHGRRVLPRIEGAARRYGVWSLFFARYLYGARIPTMFFWGMRPLAFHKFAALDALNCLAWAATFSGLGYLFANNLQRLVGELERVESWLLVGVPLFVLLLALRYYLAELNRSRSARSDV